MRIPDRLVSLTDEGIIEDVVRPLMSGKEAQVYLVISGGAQCVAKVYKEAHDRSFKQRAQYTEGRVVRNTRDQRAMTKRTRHGREQDEAAWRAAEVDVIYRLRAAGVRVPTPHHFIDGVLIMELITDADGNPAPRLGDVSFDRDGAIKIFDQLLAEVVRMLCAGVVHGDLSSFNVLMGTDGPVIIDFPQAVNASSNQNARTLLLRDVDNLQRFLAEFVPGRPATAYAQEMWNLYQRGELTPEARLTGRFRAEERVANTEAVLALISDAEHDERQRRQNLGLSMRGTAQRRVEVPVPQKGRRDHAPPARRDASGPPRREPAAPPRRDQPGPLPRDAQAQPRRDGRALPHRDAQGQPRRDAQVHVRRDAPAEPQQRDAQRRDQPAQPRREHQAQPRDPQAQLRRDPAVQRSQDTVDKKARPVDDAVPPRHANAQHDAGAQPAKNRKRRRRRRKNRGGNAAGSVTQVAASGASAFNGPGSGGNESDTP